MPWIPGSEPQSKTSLLGSNTLNSVNPLIFEIANSLNVAPWKPAPRLMFCLKLMLTVHFLFI